MRPEILNPLFAALTDLKGIGAQLAKPLTRLGLNRVIDALFHLPTGRIERVAVAGLADAVAGQQIVVTLTAQSYTQGRSARAPFRVEAFDRAGDHVSIVYFGRASGLARKQFPLGEARQVAGRLDLYGDGWQMVHPSHVSAIDDGALTTLNEAIYPLTEGITSARIASIVDEGLRRVPALTEWIDPAVLARERWPGFGDALRRAHANPADTPARDRLAYDELFASQLALMLIRAHQRSRRTVALVPTGRLRDRLNLPYALTGAQQRAVAAIDGDMAQPQPMLRLLQGDVGSGKTVVALMAMLGAVEAGAQAALLAPTEILARQHFATLQGLCAGLDVNLAILTGRDKGRAREATLMGLADGSIDILVGTHAIFQAGVTYRRLGLVIIDEQHRFGVAQRLLLTDKAARPPHLLVMTATPIPRTLMLSNHGEMDVSALDEMPPGRQPIETRVIAADRVDEVIAGLARHIDGGGQAYWVCPLVTESDTNDLTAAEVRFATLRERFGADRVGLVHGQMKPADRDVVMDRFARNQLQVLVATTVIEVGVDVPNATLMIIEGADRFGLAQLHQLRGRVGRGSGKSVCLLLRGGGLSETARARLALMRETNDGFRIAEEDLTLRGGGELLGLAQSGDGDFRVTTADQLVRLLPVATDDARLLVEAEGGLADSARGPAARLCLYLFERDAAITLLRSG